MSDKGGGGGGTSKGGTTNLKVSFSQVVADELPLWIGVDAGIFRKHGLNVSLVSLSSSDGFPALVSGQTQLASIGASEMVSGAASGAKVSYLATLTPVFPYELYAKVPGKQLKGKRIGITTTSGSLYIATLDALKQLGLSKTDVNLVPLGSVTNVNNALASGTIDAAMTHPPATTKLDSLGYHSVLDLAKQKIPTSNVGIAATKAYVSGHKKQVQDFIDAIMEAIKREKSDKAYSITELQKHLQVSDQKALAATYDYYTQEVLPDVPTPTVAQLATSQQVLAASRPEVSKLDLSSIVDASFVKAAG
ncbi:ABC transporter substrate-binding protein [uncultured Jatrophihabitans sp.]|uniref:ABC transporter substrate-binding protein n=1 Tax=uncultured Jatrophihabitans sp. TaxID=1610747 RepID=UPI0035CC7AD4